MILLSLAYIPDIILKSSPGDEFTFEPGWQFYFKQRMEKFKAEFDALVEVDADGKFENTMEFQLVEDPSTKRKWYQNMRDMSVAKERYTNLKIFEKKQTLTFDTKWKY